MYYYFPSSGMNGTLYYLNSHKYYLEGFAELREVYSFMEHQRVETYPWKCQIPMKAQTC